MTQSERRIYLITSLLAEREEYRNVAIPTEENEEKQLLRSLFNLRYPNQPSREFLEIQDAYLKEELEARGIVDAKTFPSVPANDRISIWQGDITRLQCDAIVNAANSQLLGCWQPCHSCIDNVIHTYAGVQLRIKCNEIMKAQGCEERTGTAKITPAYNLPSKYVLHTVGPIVHGILRKTDCKLLESCYQSCLELAVANGVESIAFCCISTGVFHFPQERAARIAVDTVTRFLEKNQSLRHVIFNVFTDKDKAIYEQILGK